jgi:hypothetical protein
MGLLKGTLTFSRYRLPGDLPERSSEQIDRSLRKFAFREAAKSSEEKNLGWTSLENALDTDFRQSSYRWGDYLLFSLRIDRWMIPPSLLKVRILAAEQQHLAETGQKKIDRHRRGDIRERVRLDLLNHTQPVPAFYEVCWSLSAQSVLFTSLSDKVLDDFQDLFKRSFGRPPCPFVPWDPQFMDPGAAAKLTAPDTELKLPGREFLTWLWFKTDLRNGRITLPDGSETEAFLAQRLVLESGDGEYSESVVCQGFHADLREGREALRRGKKIKEARLKLSRDAASWEFTFKADQFQFQSLKIPLVTDGDDEQEDRGGRILERLYLLERAIQTMDQLFSMFLSLRLSPQWPKEKARMDRWLNP